MAPLNFVKPEQSKYGAQNLQRPGASAFRYNQIHSKHIGLFVHFSLFQLLFFIFQLSFFLQALNEVLTHPEFK